MLVLVQWSRANASAWESVDSSEWSSLPTRAARARGPAKLDSERGWITALCVQGVVFQGDRYAVEHLPDGCAVWTAQDEPRVLRCVRFWPLAPDPSLMGALNTRQLQRVFSDDVPRRAAQGTLNAPVSRAKPPPDAAWRHGVTLPDALYAEHVRARALRPWREWTEHVDSRYLKGGRVTDQRRLGLYVPPKGTRTYYIGSATLANGLHVAANEVELTVSPSGLTTLSSGSIASNGDTVLTAVSPAGEPDHAQWPTGDYRVQIDCLSVNTDITYGCLDLGSQGAGHFARVNAALSVELETKPQQEAAFSLTGLRLATTGNVSWAAGNASDRFEVAIAADKATGMGTSTMTLEVGESDDFADGPWTPAGGGDAPQGFWFGSL